MDTYGKLCTEYYELSKPEAPADALAFYLQRVRNAQGPILEPMCGSGRFLVPILAAGFEIDGIDNSPDMLDVCRKKLKAKGLETSLDEQALVNLDMPRQYGLVFIPGASFGLIINPTEARQCLDNLFAHLLPGGMLALEVEVPASMPKTAGIWKGQWLTRPDGGKMVLSILHNPDPQAQVNTSLGRYELFVDGRLIATELQELPVRFYEPEAFEGLLKQVGFEAIRVLKPYTDQVADVEDRTVVFECRKPNV